MMNEIEVDFRKEFANPRKKVKALDNFINHLLENDHVLEANYYLNKLLEIKPKHEKSLRLGYKIAIRMFDRNRVIFFDKQLIEIKAKNELIIPLQLEYYFSMRCEAGMYRCLSWFVEQKSINLEDFNLINLIIESSKILRKYEFIPKLLNQMKKHKCSPSRETEIAYKKIALEQLVKTLRLVYV